MEIQTVTVTGYWLDLLHSFIESDIIYSVGEGPCNDVTKTESYSLRVFFFSFRSNTNNFETNLFNPLMRPNQVLTLWTWVELGVMTVKTQSAYSYAFRKIEEKAKIGNYSIAVE